MNHYPFRNWILDEAELNVAQQEELEAHLAECPQCAQISRSLSAALQVVRAAPERSAPPGFTRRWVNALNERQREQERKQARTLTIVLGATAFTIALVSLYIFLPEISLISLAAGIITAIVGLLNSVQQVINFIVGTFTKISTSTLVLSALVISGWIILASLTLGLSIWKLAFRKSEVYRGNK